MFDLIPLIKAVGYLGIFGIVFAESGLFIGFFLPGDSLLFTAGFLASQGFLNIWNLIFVIFIGAVIGDNFGYAFGKKVGPMIFKKEDSFLFHKDNLNKAKMFYEKYGGKAVILARFMPGIRTFAPILAGVGKMKYSKFLAFNIIGGALWGMGLPLLGYYLGNVIPNIDRYIVFIVLLIILISVSPMIWHVIKDKTTRDRILNILYKKTKYTNKSRTFQRSIRPRWKDFFNTHSSPQQATEYSGKVRDKLVVFNWKMNPETLEGAIDIAKKSDHKNIVIAPPFVFIEEVGKIIKKAELGAQDLFYKDIKSGSFTGEISASELANLGVKYVIIGHSERRAMGESDEIISKKIKTALGSGLVPILCVGESQKESGIMNNELNASKEFVRNQLEKDLALIHNSSFLIRNSLIVAYEPIWAIGTGNNCSPEIALKMIEFIKNILNSQLLIHNSLILYGGSVNPENINDFIKYKGIDGVLVGGASLDPKLFF